MVAVCMFAPVGKNGSADYCEGNYKLKIKSIMQSNQLHYAYQYIASYNYIVRYLIQLRLQREDEHLFSDNAM